MATLIFATATAASPLISLDVDSDEVLRYLSEPPMAWGAPITPSLAAILFFRGLSPDRFDEWQPSLESVPVLSIEDAEDGQWADITWDSERWVEWQAPDLPEFHEPLSVGFGQ
jgi:hypothetical protein